mgnify:CR=1 FL=1
MTCGVPQGSILGPLLFSIYVNDMVQSVNCDLYLYADDSALVFSSKNTDDIENRLCEEMESLSIWLEENKLSLHLGKTESILFASNKRLKRTSELDISCNGIKVKAKEFVNYLGVTLHQRMSGKIMGTSILQNINAKVKYLYRKRIFCGIKEKKMML